MTTQTETTRAREMTPALFKKKSAFDVSRMAALDIGQRMPDGTVYAGVSPDSGKPMYTTPNDVKLRIDWSAARNYAETLDTHGHRDWRVPNPADLNTVFNNRAAIGNFDETGVSYWTSETSVEKFYGFAIFARAQRFSDGFRNGGYYKGSVAALRCVRG